ncbi:hypothetical protein ACOMHN_028539 [Nucella lapillus]
MRQVTMMVTQVMTVLLILTPPLAAFDARQMIGQTYQEVEPGRGTGALSMGLPAVGGRLSPPLAPAFTSLLQRYRKGWNPKRPDTDRLFPARPQSGLSGGLSPLFQGANPSPRNRNTPLGGGAMCDGGGVVCVEGRYRTADGSCNNVHGHPAWGMARTPQERMLPPVYQDGEFWCPPCIRMNGELWCPPCIRVVSCGVSMYQNGRDSPRARGVRGQPLPTAREISQVLHTGDNQHTESASLTHLFTMWGQFLDHDITHTPVARDADGSKLDCCNQPLLYPERDLYWLTPSELRNPHKIRTSNPNCFPISIQPGRDRYFNQSCMNFVRSKPFAPTPTCRSRTREQGNTQTSFIDASQVYGPSLGDQFALRTRQHGYMKSAGNDLLPKNSTTMCTRHEGEFCFGSGDPRVNEHPMLSSMHVVFHRLHNGLASRLALLNPHWGDETLFQEARKIMGAIMQHVTFAEYLPLVLGGREMSRYNLTLHGAAPHVYRPHVNPGIFNAFSTAAFRFGHSMVNSKNSFGYQKLNLRDTFFHPHFVQHGQGEGLNMVLNGLIRDPSQGGDLHMNLDLTDHLFQNSAGKSLDLASLNVQRGRDHGLAPHNEFRQLCGLPSLRDAVSIGKFADVPFLRVYRALQDVDLFTGGLAEGPVEGGVVGPTFACILATQFHNLKFGDRFWYQNTNHAGAFTPAQIQTIEGLGLADLLCAATTLGAVQINPFVKASFGNPVRDCSSLPPLDLSAWQEI